MLVMDFGLLIPVYKPTPQLAYLLETLATRFSTIVLVDDGNTEEEHQHLLSFEKKGVKVLRHEMNKGKGEALKTGLTWFVKQKNIEAVVTADADGQHHPTDILNLMNAYAAEPDSVYLGVRDFAGDVPLSNRLGNQITRFIFRLLTGRKLKDTQTGLRVFPRAILPTLLDLKGSRYDYEMNVLIHVVKQDIPLQEISIYTVYEQKHAFSSFRKWRDSFLIYRALLGPFLTFTFVSLSSFVLDLVLFLLFYTFIFLNNPSLIFLAVILARLVSGVYNFIMNRVVTFQSKQSWLVAGSQYIVLYVVVLGLSASGTQLFLPLFSMQPWLTKVLVDGGLFIFSFFIQRTVIFKHV